MKLSDNLDNIFRKGDTRVPVVRICIV